MILEPPVFRDQGLMFSSTCPAGVKSGRGLPQSMTLRDGQREWAIRYGKGPLGPHLPQHPLDFHRVTENSSIENSRVGDRITRCRGDS